MPCNRQGSVFELYEENIAISRWRKKYFQDEPLKYTGEVLRFALEMDEGNLLELP